METQRMQMQRLYDAGTEINQAPLRVNPNLPLQSSLPSTQTSLTNGSARTTSKKRRPSGAGPARTPIEDFPQPPAPEVPNAPPLSYRPPYGTENFSQPEGNYTASFAERARALTGKSIPAEPPDLNPDPLPQPARPERRGSLNRPIGGLYTEIQKHKRDSYPPPNGPASPRRFSNPASPRQFESRSGNPPSRKVSSATAQQYEYMNDTPPSRKASSATAQKHPETMSPVTQPSTRRASTSVTQPPRKEWAPEHSPLQKLEAEFTSKEKKRARVEAAEQKLRESQAHDRHHESGRGNDFAADRSTSRQITTNTEAAKPRRLPGKTEVNRPDRHREQLIRESQPQRASGRISSDSYQPLSLDRTGKASTRSADKHQFDQQFGRGVRFQGEEDTEDLGAYSSDMDKVDSHSRRRSWGTDALAKSDEERAARREKLRQDPVTVGKRTSSRDVPTEQQELYTNRAERLNDHASAATYGGAPDPVPRHTVPGQGQATKYAVPPQTAAGIHARQIVGFGSGLQGVTEGQAYRKHHLATILHRGHDHTANTYEESTNRPRNLDEWKQGGTARLTAADFVTGKDSNDKGNTWWEESRSSSRRKSGKARLAQSLQGDHQDKNAPALATFNPPLYLKCGPLLRYTGLKRDRLQTQTRSGLSSSQRETWRGSVMIVTADADSTYDPAPTLRLFPEAMDLLPPPPQHVEAEDGHDLPAEYIDPIAGLPKLSRRGKTVYVKPVDDLEQGVDLSRLEDDDGLFEEFRTAAVPTAYGTPDFHPGRGNGASQTNPKFGGRGERASKRGQQVRGVRLHAERGVTFWRFNLEVELSVQQIRVAYSINGSPSVGFWIPGRGQSMNVMFHSCNGFSMSVNPDNFSGPDPLWRDVLNCHQTRPFHVMIGGGDQIYNDAVMSQSPRFREWLEIKNPHHKHEAEFSLSMHEELETFYLERYSMWFSQGLFGMANSQIPMVNMWDDHDIIDGFGSYPHHFMSTPVFCGLGAVAFKYYMLFQHQSVPDEGPADEPSWLMGSAPGPYINELSRSIFVSLGKNVALLALDCRTERTRETILSEATYQMVLERCRREIIEGETKHLVVVLGVPIAYPRLVWLENLITSRVMDPVKALGRAGMLGGFLNKFDGGVEILDDLDDHWTAKNHKQERNWFVQELQELAAEKSVRVTILGGDVHLAAVGQFYSNPKLKIPKDRDHRYMANVVSSAIVNTPPPNNMADILNRRNKTHHLDGDTDEDMIPMFIHDVNGKVRNNKRLLPRRNWCSIREYYPGSTPPPTPPQSEPQTPSDESPPPPTRLQRTLSLTRGDVKAGNLIRRLSGRGPPPSNDYPPSNKYDTGDSPSSPPPDGYFPPQPKMPQRAATISGNGDQRRSSAPLPRPGNFHRRPTNVSEKAAAKGGDLDDTAGHINLEHGLDIVLNCEVNQKDPAGISVPYRLLIPALWYEGEGDVNTETYKKKGLLSRLGSMRGTRRNTLAGGQVRGRQDSLTPSESEGENEDEAEAEAEPVKPRRWSFGVSQRRQYRDQTPPVEREYGDQRPQRQRDFEDRNQQIGQTKQQPFSMPPRQERQYGELGQQQGQFDKSDFDETRHDSVDYHQHLDASPPNPNSGYPGRKPSKVDRMLGVGPMARANSSSANDGNNLLGSADAHGNVETGAESHPESGGYESEEYEEERPKNSSGPISQGYSGIEAYTEKRDTGWRRFLNKVKDIEEKSSGRRAPPN